MAARWKGFGLSMGLRSDTLDRIEGDYRKVDDCLQALLNEWLKQENTLRGPPSWQLLVDAVASPAGGNNQALAQQIARRHNGIYNNSTSMFVKIITAFPFLSHIYTCSQISSKEVSPGKASYYTLSVSNSLHP